MKTDEEWVQWFDDKFQGITSEGPSDGFLKEFVTKIQADALRHAADIAYGNWLLHGSRTVRKSITSIIEEADKLEGKS